MCDSHGTPSLPKELAELQAEIPGIKITELPTPTTNNLSGKVKVLEYGSCLLYELGKLLWVEDKKFRVTIECDPETGKFTAVREEV